MVCSATAHDGAKAVGGTAGSGGPVGTTAVIAAGYLGVAERSEMSPPRCVAGTLDGTAMPAIAGHVAGRMGAPLVRGCSVHASFVATVRARGCARGREQSPAAAVVAA